VDPLEEVRSDEVLEAGRLAGNQRPVEVVVLLLLLHGPEAWRAEGSEPEDGVEPLEDAHPARHRLVGDLQILPEGVDGERGPDELGEAEGEELQAAEVGNPFEPRYLLAHEEVPVLPRPAAGGDLGTGEVGLGKAAEGQEVTELGGARQLQLTCGERVEPEEVIAPLERIAPVAVKVEAGAPGHEDLLAGASAVEEALE